MDDPNLRMLPHPETSVPRHACWPLGGEIDIMQSFGRGRGGPGARAGTVESGYHFAPKVGGDASCVDLVVYPWL